MLQQLSNLPAGIIGVEAHGKVTKADYETTLVPLMEEAYKRGKRIRFLYRFAPDFSEMTAGAAWDDMRVGLRHMRLIERCAVVSDQDWIRNATRVFASLMPFPVQAFTNAELTPSIQWLETPSRDTNLTTDLLADKGVLVVEPKGPLRAEDFDRVAADVDPWIEQHHGLHGLVLHARSFPGWEDFGSFLRHVQFVREHHKSIERIAVAGGGLTLDVLPKIAGLFVKAQVKAFDYDQLAEATTWAGRHAS
jgi:hypothetical protein